MSCNNGVIETNDPDRPWIKCQKCGELEAKVAALTEVLQEIADSTNSSKWARLKAGYALADIQGE